MSSLSIRFGAHTSRCAEICTRSQVHTQLLRARADRGYVDTVDRKTAQSRTHIRRASRVSVVHGAERGVAPVFVSTCLVNLAGVRRVEDRRLRDARVTRTTHGRGCRPPTAPRGSRSRRFSADKSPLVNASVCTSTRGVCVLVRWVLYRY